MHAVEQRFYAHWIIDYIFKNSADFDTPPAKVLGAHHGTGARIDNTNNQHTKAQNAMSRDAMLFEQSIQLRAAPTQYRDRVGEVGTYKRLRHDRLCSKPANLDPLSVAPNADASDVT